MVDGDGAAELFEGEGAHVLRQQADAPVSAKQLLHSLVNTGAWRRTVKTMPACRNLSWSRSQTLADMATPLRKDEG